MPKCLNPWKGGRMTSNKIKIVLAIFLFAILLRAEEVDSARVYIQMGSTALSKGDFEQAAEYFQHVLRFRPGHAAATYNVACSYSLMDNKPEAIKWLNKTIDLGMYSFDQDQDLDNIRETREYKNLLARANKLLKKLKGKVLEPVIYLPTGFDSTKDYPLLLAMHGWGSNPIDFSKNFNKVADDKGYIVCSPYGPDVMGTASFGWGEPEQGESRVLETIDRVQEKYHIDKDRIVLLGFSQGGWFAYYIGLKDADLFRGVISIAGSYDSLLDQYLLKAKERGLRFYMMVGENEPERRIQGNFELLTKFINEGITASLNMYAGYGHTIPGDLDFEVKHAIEWVEKSSKK